MGYNSNGVDSPSSPLQRLLSRRGLGGPVRSFSQVWLGEGEQILPSLRGALLNTGEYFAKKRMEATSAAAASPSNASRRSHPNSSTSPGISVSEAALHLVRGNLGPGCLALPYAFAKAGWLGGIAVLLLTIAQGIYTIHLLSRCRLRLASNGVKSLGDLVESIFGRRARIVVQFFLLMNQSGICCVYMGIVAGALSGALPASLNPGHRWLVVAMLPVFMVLGLLRFISQLTALSLLGNIAMGTAVFAAAVYGGLSLWILQDQGHDAWVEATMPQRSWTQLVQLSASTFYAYEGIGLVLPIENAMKEPARFSQSIAASSMILTASFISVGLLCGVAFRDEMASGDIISFLFQRAKASHTTADQVVFGVLSCFVTVTVLITFPLQLLPVSDVVAAWLASCRRRLGANPASPTRDTSANGDPRNLFLSIAPEASNDGETSHAMGMERPMRNGESEDADLGLPDESNEGHAWIAQRLCLIVCFAGVAILVPNVAHLVALTGAIGSTGLALVAPICHLMMPRSTGDRWPRTGKVVDAVVIIFCLLVMFLGVTSTLADMARDTP